jgi:hypothetical protein
LFVYLCSIALKFLGSKRKIFFLMFQFIILLTVFNVISYDYWSNIMNNKQIRSAIGDDTYIIDGAIKEIEKINPEKIPNNWNENQIEYLESKYNNNFHYFYSNYNQMAENGNSIRIIYMENELFKRIASVYFKYDIIYFYGNSLNEINEVSINGEKKILNKKYILNKAEVMKYLTLNENDNFIVFPIPPDNTLYKSENDLSILIDKNMTNDERTEIGGLLSTLNDGVTYSFRKLTEYPNEEFNQVRGEATINLMFFISTMVVLFVGYLGYLLVQYLDSYKKIQSLRLFGAKKSHIIQIFMIWNFICILPGYFISLLTSYLIINQISDVGYFSSFIKITIFVVILMLIMGSIPISLKYIKTGSQNLVNG